MAKSRRTRAALEQEIQKLIDEKKESEEKAAAVFAKAFLTKEMRSEIADMSDAEIKELAKKMADEVKISNKKSDGKPVEKKKTLDEIFVSEMMTADAKKKLNASTEPIVKQAALNISNLIDNVLNSAKTEVEKRKY